jgi:hypothetical protein
VSSCYEIRIAGQFDSTAAAAFEGLNITACGHFTVVRGELDQAGLHGVLERIRSLGLDLVDVRRVRGSLAGRRPVTGRSYEIRVLGSLGPAASEAFADVAFEVEPTATVLHGDLDQAHLHALLDRVRALGLELVDIR